MAWLDTDVQNSTNKLETLSEDERKAYGHLFEGYSEAWTAETLGLERWEAKKLFADLYHKLGVASSRELILRYAPDVPRVCELDSYQ